MKLNNNHLLIFAFAIAAGLYIWNDSYSGRKEGFYQKMNEGTKFTIGMGSFFLICGIVALFWAGGGGPDAAIAAGSGILSIIMGIIVIYLGFL